MCLYSLGPYVCQYNVNFLFSVLGTVPVSAVFVDGI